MKLFGIIWLVSIFILGFLVSQHDFLPIIFGYGTGFVASYLLITNKQISFRDLIVLGLVARGLLFFNNPALSDDIYRFIWDGRMILEGINPYAWTPSMVKSTIDTGELYHNLNSQEYYSVYPIICQAIFLIATWLSGSSIFWSGLIIKIFLLMADLSIFRLLTGWLKSQGKDPRRALWYLLNPLVLIETFGNLHFEVIMIVFMLYAFIKLETYWVSAVSLAGGIATKLLPAMAIPLIIFSLKWKPAVKYLTVLCLVGFILFSPILLVLQDQGFSQSINLYFQTFEFNASLYYIFREVGWLVLGYNGIHVIGPLMAAIAGLIIVLISFSYRSSFKTKWPEALLFIFTIYFLFATTVHPWYILTPLVLSLMTNYHYAIVWSAMVTLSYHAYWYQPTEEILSLIVIEYLVVGVVLIRDFRQKRVAQIKTSN